jgi:hypothetical protein
MIPVLAGAEKNIGFAVERRNSKVKNWSPKLW